MRICFVVPYTPSLIRVRPYNLIRYLARRGHAVTVLTLHSGPGDVAALAQLRACGVRVCSASHQVWHAGLNMVRALPTATPLQAAYSRSGTLEALLDGELTSGGWSQPEVGETVGLPWRGPVDIVHVEHLRGAHYALRARQVLATNGRPVPVIWDAVDSISLLFERALAKGHDIQTRLVAWLELARSRRYEAWLARQFNRVLVTSPQDANAFRSVAGVVAECSGQASGRGGAGLPLSVLRNGVDLAYFQPSAQPREAATLVFTGKMSYHANVAAALHLLHNIMPLIWAVRPEVRVEIVGQKPPRDVLTAARRWGDRVSVTGGVPDLRPYLGRATVAVCPLTYGVGIQNKALEAMAMATPVVATPQAVSALATQADRDILVGDTPGEFAARTLQLLADSGLRQRVGQAGRDYVEQWHDWEQVAGQLETIYEEEIAHAG